MPNGFSYQGERGYYSRKWPRVPLPYAHLEPYLRAWLDPAIIFEGKRLLDIGAGECLYSRLIADKFEARQVVACELFRERMLPAFGANQNLRLQFVAGDIFTLPFQSRTFDVVFGSFVLCQLTDLRRPLAEIRRVLTDTGVYVGIEPNPFNVVVVGRQLLKNYSPNLRLFWPWNFRPVFAEQGFRLQVTYFFAKVPRLRSRFLGTCMGLYAAKMSP